MERETVYPDAEFYSQSFHEDVRSWRPDRSRYPYYHLVPKDPIGNAKYRAKWERECLTDMVARTEVLEMCRRDTLFWFNTFCISEGTPVVTNTGLVPIEDVTSAHKVWDGDGWVSQEGAVYRGRKSVINAYGVWMTPDHEVFTDRGWHRADKRYPRAAVNLPDIDITSSGPLEGSESVYDLVNCGPKRAFTVIGNAGHGLLVHNCWLHEPRPRPKTIPFVTWPHQDLAISVFDNCLGYEDAGLKKSRGEGASWIGMLLFLKYWLFGDPVEEDSKEFVFGVVSRSEDSVDTANDISTLLPKLDWELKKLPFWMVPDGYDPKKHRNHSRHTMLNPVNGSMITGFSCTADVATGARTTSFFMDEMSKWERGKDYDAMSSTQHVTDSRLIVSTFKGADGYYYDAMCGMDSSIRKVTLDWRDNPTRNRGLYVMKNGRFRAVHEENPLPDDYRQESRDCIGRLRDRGYRIDGSHRSPWYDRQCDRTGATPNSIAEELDMDPEKSGSPYFNVDVINRLLSQCRAPNMVGEISYALDSCEPVGFEEAPRGGWSLWCALTSKGCPVSGVDYFIGIDVAAGTGGAMSSNSTISIANKRGQKVAEFALPDLFPDKLAKVAYAAGHFFKGPNGPALLCHECNGPTGAQFSKAIVDLGYPRLFMDVVETTVGRKKSDRVGYWNQGDKRGNLYGGYRAALGDGFFSNPSRQALEECKMYENTSGGGVEHVSAMKKKDVSGAGMNHGDRCTADAICWRILSDVFEKPVRGREPEDATIENENAPVGSFLARRNESRLRFKEESHSW